MKIIPNNFKQQAKFLKSQIQKSENIKIPSTKLNDQLAIAYGWTHYHEMKKVLNSKDQSKYKQEYNLTLEEESKIISNKMLVIQIMVAELHRYNVFLDEKITKEDMKSFQIIAFRLSRNILPLINKEYLLKKRNLLKRNLLPLSQDRLTIHSLIIQPDYKSRINSAVNLFCSNQKTSISSSAWIVNSLELNELSSFIKKMKNNNKKINITEIEDNTKIDFEKDSQHYDHNFYLFEGDKNDISINYNTIKPSKIIDYFREVLGKKLGTPLNDNENRLRYEQVNKVIYVNADLFDLNSNNILLHTQGRALGIASIVGVKSLKSFLSENKENIFSIIANTNNFIIDIADIYGRSIILGKEDKKYTEDFNAFIAKNPKIKSLARLPYGEGLTSEDNYVFLDAEGDVIDLLSSIFNQF
jgi:hypothetical protein